MCFVMILLKVKYCNSNRISLYPWYYRKFSIFKAPESQLFNDIDMSTKIILSKVMIKFRRAYRSDMPMVKSDKILLKDTE